ncbi:MAG TPA: hypothetical protein VHX14_14370 [Thermoanaerobaculia bacterium]|jgi:hypothetical protein|nr:hypothetical protein [Thermoanaerobaculia bacterium]
MPKTIATLLLIFVAITASAGETPASIALLVNEADAGSSSLDRQFQDELTPLGIRHAEGLECVAPGGHAFEDRRAQR